MNTNPQTLKLDHPGDKDAYYGKKPEQAKQPNGTFIFQCVMRFEIDPETAENLLVESDPTLTVHNWLLTQKPSSKDIPYSGNATTLKADLGRYLADKAISKARLLLPKGTPAIPPF